MRVEGDSLACPLLLPMGLLSVLADWKLEDKAAWERQFPDTPEWGRVGKKLSKPGGKWRPSILSRIPWTQSHGKGDKVKAENYQLREEIR